MVKKVELHNIVFGSLYHHFQSKRAFYGVLRDDMTRRVLDRMEAVAESFGTRQPHQPRQALKAALMAAYDGVLRIQAGKLLTEIDPRGSEDAIAALLGELAAQDGMAASRTLGILLAAAMRAALTRALAGHEDARQALESLLSGP